MTISQLPLASLPRRLAAVGYESLLIGAVLIGAGFALAPLVSPSPETVPAAHVTVPSLSARIALFAVLMGIGAAYFGWFWTNGRKTLPMQTWKLRITRADGRPLGWGIALARYAAFWLGPALSLAAYLALKNSAHSKAALLLLALNYAWALVDPGRQFLHDRIAGTRIVALR